MVSEKSGLPVDVDVVEELGSDGYLYGHSTIDGAQVDIVSRVDAKHHPHHGDKVKLTPEGGITHLFDVETGLRLN